MTDTKSKKLNEYVAKEYYVTAASWLFIPSSTGPVTTYEIGIRSKAMNGDFTLLQSEKYNHQSVQEMAELICLALDHGFDPRWCQEYLS